MLKLIFLFFIICCSFNIIAGTKFSYQSVDTTITGTAKNAKWGAVVITDTGNTFYIDEKQEWEPEFLNTKIEVKGLLKKQTYTEKDVKDEDGNYSQGMIGTKKTLWKAQIKTIKK